MDNACGTPSGSAAAGTVGSLLTILIPWRWHESDGSFASRAILTVVWAANMVLAAITISGFVLSDAGYDWLIYLEAGERLGNGALYVWGEHYAWSYSPLLAYLFAIIAPIGFVGWSLLHFGALAFLRDRRIAVLALLSWPFWADVYNGNTMAFVLVAAVGALGRNALATGVYLLLCLLMPRPVMLPLMAWILWRQPEWRIRFLVMVALNAVLVLANGYASDWFDALRGVPDAVGSGSRDIGPSKIVGVWWLPVGAVAAVILTLRGRIGWASLAASPYWLPQYLLMLMLELVRPPRSDSGR